MRLSSILRLLMALFFVGCGVGAAAFALSLFGANARTISLGVAAVSAGGLVAAVADNGVAGFLWGDTDQIVQAYDNMGTVIMVLGALLGVSVVFLLTQVLVAMFRALFF